MYKATWIYCYGFIRGLIAPNIEIGKKLEKHSSELKSDNHIQESQGRLVIGFLRKFVKK